ncbi:MAG: M1 family metallopeptidase [Acidobacteria bacterium]|nr:M1 family metallopeptidase [Acidobacteriota bacterium]
MRIAALFCLGLALWGGTASPDRWFKEPKSPRIANYRIEGTLDWPGKTFEGRETITWRNAGTAPTQEFPLHLYLNAFKGPQSLFVKESGGRLRTDRIGPPEDAASWGYCTLRSVRVEGQALDGHYGEDETVYWVRLGRPVDPGETIQVEIAWESRFPKVFARSGWSKDFLMAGQWFPKVGVYQGDRWNCHPYHAATEFFSDFGVYDVELSLPNFLKPAYTGTPVRYRDPEGREHDAWPDPKHPKHHLWKLHAEDVHDFAWAVMPSMSWGFKGWTYRGVEVFYYYQAANLDNLPRQRAAVEAALRSSAEWFFPYPYPVLTEVDVPKDASGADGMEYPTLITSGSSPFDPFRFRLLEVVAVHEFGHQYFYGMLASNEFEEPWLDEGFTSWFTHRAMQRTYFSHFGTRRFQVGTDTLEWVEYWLDPTSDPLTRRGWETRNMESYFRIAYAKPVLVLDELEATLGRPVMERVMKAYAEEMAFRHPTRQDFRRIAERVTGRDLSAFWKDFVEGTETLDYAISEVRTLPVQTGGWTPSTQGLRFVPPQQVAPGNRGAITLVRRGGLVAPMTLWVRLENRKEFRLTWDGKDRWKTFDDPLLFDAPVQAAILDPDRNHPMLKDRLHAHWVARPTRRGFHYWAQLVWGSLTGILQGAGLG